MAVKAQATISLFRVNDGNQGFNLALKSDDVSDEEESFALYNLTEALRLNERYTCTVWGTMGDPGTNAPGYWLWIGEKKQLIGYAEQKDEDGHVFQLSFTLEEFGEGAEESANLLCVDKMGEGSVSAGTIEKVKIEHGVPEETVWSPALQDGLATEDALSDVNRGLTDKYNGVQQDLDSTKKDLSNVQESQRETDRVVSEHTDKISSLTQRADGFVMDFLNVTERVEQIGDDYYTVKDELYKYIKFIDGEIWLGKEADPGEDDLRVVIRNDRVSFYQNNVEVAYISNNTLFITDANVISSLRIGDFLFRKRANGNVGLVMEK